MRKTTKKEYAAFKKSVNHWIDRFGLHEWTVVLTWGTTGNSDAIGACCTDSQNLFAEIFFSHEIEKGILFDPAEVGKHEVMHLLLAPLKRLAFQRFTTETEIDKEDERIVTRLEQCVS